MRILFDMIAAATALLSGSTASASLVIRSFRYRGVLLPLSGKAIRSAGAAPHGQPASFPPA